MKYRTYKAYTTFGNEMKKADSRKKERRNKL